MLFFCDNTWKTKIFIDGKIIIFLALLDADDTSENKEKIED
jgi:hypothetical protein